MANQLAYARLVRTTLAQPGRIRESDHEHHQVFDLIHQGAVVRSHFAVVGAGDDQLVELVELVDELTVAFRVAGLCRLVGFGHDGLQAGPSRAPGRAARAGGQRRLRAVPSSGRVRRPPGGRLAKDGNGAERMMREHVRRSHQALLSGWDAAEEA
ncbi:hypothetical protein ACFRLW_40020 [Streptomyces sp. NPDC056728]|uniref:hypothetical protein n=1 Tax=Streptomyces sp. NPDC056721 TaxID=3345923 RepID=UPI0036B4A8D7